MVLARILSKALPRQAQEMVLTRFDLFNRRKFLAVAWVALALTIMLAACLGPREAQARPTSREFIAQALSNPTGATPGDASLDAAQTDPSGSLDSAKTSLDQIEAQLGSDSLTDADLLKLRAALDPVQAELQAIIAAVTPKLNAVKARLEQIGPAPDPKANPAAAPEDPAVTAERVETSKAVAANDDLIKRANVALLRDNQLAGAIADHRRALFAASVFKSSSSIVAPSLWIEAVGDAPRRWSLATASFGEALSDAAQALAGRAAFYFAAMLAGLIAATLIATRLARKVLAQNGSEPSEFRKALTAFWIAISRTAIPVVAIGSLAALCHWFGFSADALKPLPEAVFTAVVAWSLALGLGRALLAPHRPAWRPVDLSDRVAQRLMSLLITLAALITVGRLIEALVEMVGASLALSVATRGSFTLLVGAALVRGLYGIAAAPDDSGDSHHPANLVDESPWWPAIRFAVWGATGLLIMADLFGYVAFSAFLVNQIAWTALISSLLFLLLKLVSEGFAEAFKPNSRLSRALVASVGLRRESLAQIAALMSGALTLGLYAIAAGLIVAPWGVQSHDMISAIKQAFFGFQLGDVTVSPSGVLAALVLFALGYSITHAIQTWLEKSYLPLTSIDQGLKVSIRTSVGYIGVTLSLLFAVAFVGINLSNLAYIAGALSVGIGLGLQGVVANFVSGLILLWERAIKVGDLVVVGGEQGFVRRINVRATEIETYDRGTVIVPNNNLMTGVVKNFVRGDRIGRVRIELHFAAGVDPERIREVLLDIARAHDEIVGIPAPIVLFTGFNANALDFVLIGYVANVERVDRIRSDLLFSAFARLQEEGLPPASTNTTLDIDFSQLAPALNRLIEQKAESQA